MATKNVLLAGGLLLVNLLSMRCSQQVAGVETTNGCTIVATATSVEGIVPPLSRVFIFDTSYIPYIDSGVGLGTAADDKGTFQFNTPPGNYHLFIVGPTGEAAGISIKSPAGGSVSKERVLGQTGVVSGTISSAASDTLLVFLEGMCHYQLIFATGAFSLRNVPEGNYLLKIARLSMSQPLTFEIMHEQKVIIYPDKITAIGEISF